MQPSQDVYGADQDWTKGHTPRYAPASLYRRVQATLERGWAGRREVVVSAALTQERPKAIDYDFIDGIVRLGCEFDTDSLFTTPSADSTTSLNRRRGRPGESPVALHVLVDNVS